jgi:hypothetical protein
MSKGKNPWRWVPSKRPLRCVRLSLQMQSLSYRSPASSTSSVSAAEVVAGPAPAHALDLFDLASSVSDGEAVAPVPCQKGYNTHFLQ